MNSEIYFITGNKNKFREASYLIPQLKQLDIDLPEIQDINPRTIIESKIEEAKKHSIGKIVCEDISLHIDALNGFPGPLIKWYLKSLGNIGIYENLCSSNKKAKTVATVAYFDGNKTHFFEGMVEGEIVIPSGEGFGFDPIFKPKGHKKTYSQMSLEEKNIISHRSIAFRKLQKYLMSEN